ncbi:unnamed protein product [Rotaria sp. Silwood2]|nr:unnamed protein product [Rotaria sp. Silwood2]CAF3073989.1 unnamed protein product [Rotaria sp. Silwood2]CAF3267649.1 unnamed protein product [Rotaria sp. Silwood2]CAF3891778.1 unnamed protein product [Rotaria sp. Silwood2]CAF3935228.1 unnamed protein product [Rotaria sp. Silwood2]
MYEVEMIPTNYDDDDEPDIIDLTTYPGYFGLFDFPIRPPTPFADSSIWPPKILQNNEDNRAYGVVTWSSPEKQSNLNYKMDNNENIALSSYHASSSPRTNNTWRRRLNKFLKRTKSNEHKTVISSTKSDVTHLYNFGGGGGEMTQMDSSISRSSGKRVHWVDDDEIVLNLCHRFVEYLKLLVQNVIDDTNEDIYLKYCQISLDELDSLIDCQHIKEAFEDIVELAKTRNKNQLLEQQTYIENLLSRTVLFSCA